MVAFWWLGIEFVWILNVADRIVASLSQLCILFTIFAMHVQFRVGYKKPERATNPKRTLIGGESQEALM